VGWGERWIVDGSEGPEGGAEIYGVRCPQPSHDISSFARQASEGIFAHYATRGTDKYMANNPKM
jgi:hypothetical protein